MKFLDINLTTAHDKEQLIRSLQQAIKIIESIPIAKKCVQCKYYDYPGICRLVNKSIPEDILGIGCETFEYDYLTPPF